MVTAEGWIVEDCSVRVVEQQLGDSSEPRPPLYHASHSSPAKYADTVKQQASGSQAGPQPIKTSKKRRGKRVRGITLHSKSKSSISNSLKSNN